MEYQSTRGTHKVDFLKALSMGLAENGGLFVPVVFPNLSHLINGVSDDFTSFSKHFLSFFLKGSMLDSFSKELVSNALNFPILHKKLSDTLSVLELFHGPTLSFKDFGARFLAQCLSKKNKRICVLVATSGDTGSAVASSFYGLENVSVVVLFPKGKVTKRQQAQICCWGGNVQAVEVDGVFDDCQSLVKQAFEDEWFQTSLTLSTANSINIGRLLPQMSYYAFASIQHFKATNQLLNFVIPAGNLGNATACVYAKKMQLPIGTIALATNDNKSVVDYLNKGHYQPRDSVETLANAMDVGNPSNFERLKHLFNTYESFKQNVAAYSVSDKAIEESIVDCFKRYEYLICPHTATAYHVANSVLNNNQCIVATAHPAKFETIIEPIIQQKILVPNELKALLDRSQSYESIAPSLDALKRIIRQ